MDRTRLSLWYVVAYLAVAGLSLLLVPNFDGYLPERRA